MKNKTRIVRYIMILLLSVLFLAGCSREQTVSEYDPYRKEWYDDTISGFGETPISTSVSEFDAVAEYRVVCNVSFQGYYYYSFIIKEDQTGLLRFKYNETEDFTSNSMKHEIEKNLSISEVKSAVSIINQNKFWKIPTNHPDELVWDDGTTIFIEGFTQKKTHFISMSEPGKELGIYKIHQFFYDMAKSLLKDDFPEKQYH